MTEPHDPDTCCGVPTVGDILAELAGERAERLRQRRADTAAARAVLAEARRRGLGFRHAQKLRNLREQADGA